MSSARKVPDAERTAIMVDLVRSQYPRISHVLIEEVAPGTGWYGTARYADVLALGVWPSKGLKLEGYEIKASKADLKRELADLAKHQAVARFCNEWWLVVWDEKLLEGLEIPIGWGVMVTVPAEHETRELKVLRKAPAREPEPWPRAFVCSMVRNAHQQSPGAHYIARAIMAAAQEQAQREALRTKAAMESLLRPLQEALYGTNSWRWQKEAQDLEAVVKLAVSKLDTAAGAIV
jgi:hypothetical protein